MLPRGQAKEFAVRRILPLLGIVLAWPPNLARGSPWTLSFLMATTGVFQSRRSQLSIRFFWRFSSELLGDWTRIWLGG
jgi:hypothetical protein